MRTFGTRGIVRPDQHYVVARTEVEGVKIRSYVIPVVQEVPSAAKENT